MALICGDEGKREESHLAVAFVVKLFAPDAASFDVAKQKKWSRAGAAAPFSKCLMHRHVG